MSIIFVQSKSIDLVWAYNKLLENFHLVETQSPNNSQFVWIGDAKDLLPPLYLSRKRETW